MSANHIQAVLHSFSDLTTDIDDRKQHSQTFTALERHATEAKHKLNSNNRSQKPCNVGPENRIHDN